MLRGQRAAAVYRRRRGGAVAALLPAGTRLGFIGDSITDHGKNSAATATTFESHESIGYQLWAGRYSGQRVLMRPCLTSAKSGLTGAQLDAMFTPVLCASGLVDLVHVMMGHNSIVLGGATIASVLAELSSTRAKLRAAGIKVLLSAILPDSGWTVAQEAIRTGVNAGLAGMANGTDTWFVDLTPYITAADGVTVLPGIYSDGTHPTNLGGERLGYGLAQWIKANVAPPGGELLGFGGGAYDASLNPYGNRLANPGMTGTSGTVGSGCTGTLPTSWTGTRSGTGVEAAFSITGDAMLQASGTGTGGGATVTISAAGGVTAGMAAGQQYVAECDLAWSGCAGIRSIDFTATLGGTTIYECRADGSDTQFIPAAGSVRLRTPLVRANGAGIVWQVIVNTALGAVATGYTVRIGSPRCYQVPASMFATIDAGRAFKMWRVLFATGGSTGGSTGGATVGVSELEWLDALGGDLTSALYSNTASSSNGTGSAPINAIDDNQATLWRSAATLATTPAWLRVGLQTPVDLTRFALRAANDATFATEAPTAGTLQYTVDGGVTWIDRLAFTSPALWTQGERRLFG